MPKRPDFHPFQRGDKWVISIPPGMSASGKRVRKVFADKKSADRYGGTMRASHSNGIRGAMISALLAREAVEAEKLLEGTGMSLLEAVRASVERFKAAGNDESFRDRYQAALLDGEGRWSDSTMAQMEKMPRWLPEWFFVLRCSQIDRPTMERAIVDSGPKSRSTIDLRCRYLSSVTNYKERHRKGKGIEIMTEVQCRAMLGACECREETWAVALLLFAGIRPSAEDGEIRKLDWEDVGEGEIYVSREVSKTSSDRHVPITQRLARLLKGHPTEGAVTPPNWKKVYQRLRKAAGIEGQQDITRHTFASHYLAVHGEEKTKAAMGHTAGSSTLFRHYRRAVTEADGLKFFA